ncbi:MAG: RIO1 family regulatory kinase/ATPase [Desulfurococcaceae archaeon]
MNIGRTFRTLVERDFALLRALESNGGVADLGVLERASGVRGDTLYLSLVKLAKLKLVRTYLTARGRLFTLTYRGLDVLALKHFVDSGVLSAIGDRVGVGKESDIFEALGPRGERLAVKFMRLGRTSFRRVRVKRDWGDEARTWLELSKAAAAREYDALKKLHSLGLSVPRPHDYNRHAIVMEYIDGIMLYERPPLRDAARVLGELLRQLCTAFNKAGIVHGDLSEYNVIVRADNETPYIIDWPQNVDAFDVRAKELLERDVKYVLKFFKKVYGVTADEETIVRAFREARCDSI